jgi:hypothetical protein
MFADSSNYGKSMALSGTDKFDDPDSDALGIIQDAIDAMHIAPNTAVTSKMVMSKLRRNRAIVAAYHSSSKQNSGERGIVPTSFIAELFGFDNIHVGASLINGAKKGQQVSLTGVWGNIFSLFYQDSLAGTEDGLTFGVTAEYENRQVSEFVDPKPGVKGVKSIKVVEQVEELIIAPECGYLLQNVL